nr:hypothetical protein CFP56_59676 [Quercus suber]
MLHGSRLRRQSMNLVTYHVIPHSEISLYERPLRVTTIESCNSRFCSVTADQCTRLCRMTSFIVPGEMTTKLHGTRSLLLHTTSAIIADITYAFPLTLMRSLSIQRYLIHRSIRVTFYNLRSTNTFAFGTRPRKAEIHSSSESQLGWVQRQHALYRQQQQQQFDLGSSVRALGTHRAAHHNHARSQQPSSFEVPTVHDQAQCIIRLLMCTSLLSWMLRMSHELFID